jgi:hypothetical protein
MLGQHWTETTYVDEANYDFNTRNITNAHWSEMYRDDSRLIYCKANTEATAISPSFTQATKESRLAQIEILSVYAWALVETFGDIPYSQSLNPGKYVLPVYDDAATIYSDLLTRLNAIPNLTNSGFGASDQFMLETQLLGKVW